MSKDLAATKKGNRYTESMQKPHIHIAHTLWKQTIKPGSVVIDATCGNGYDSLIIAKHAITPGAGTLHCMDVQEMALEMTKKRLEEGLPRPFLNRVVFHKACHSTLPSKANLIVYNLGYLPGSDKRVKTQPETTLKSIQTALDSLLPGGLMTITCYPGHKEGAEEEVLIKEHLASLPPKSARVCHYTWINRPSHPSLFSIELCSSK